MVYNVYGDNTTTLAAQSVKLDESFVPSYGLAEAMLESAQNDFAVFGAMLKSDALQMKLNEAAAEDPKAKESAEKVASASKDNIVEKIKKGFEWLMEKIMSAINAFQAKIMTLINRDEAFVKKYDAAINNNAAEIANVKIKAPVAGLKGWVNKGVFSMVAPTYKKGDETFKTLKLSDFFIASGDEAAEISLGEFGVNKLIKEFKEHCARMKSFKTTLVSQCNTNIKNAKKELTAGTISIKATDSEAGKAYKTFQSYKNTCLANVRMCQKASVAYYKFLKAAIVKAAGSVAKTEACVLDYLVEEAQCEVDDIMDMEVSKDPENVEDVSQADTELTDSSVSDDAEKLVYDKTDCYSQEESAFIFDDPLF